MSTRTPECWVNDPNAEALRIKVSPERSLLLPHDQFMFAELTDDGDDQNLKLVFAAHEVLIRGHHLRRIETGMQRMDLAQVTVLPGYQRSLIPDGQPVILEITVKEAKHDVNTLHGPAHPQNGNRMTSRQATNKKQTTKMNTITEHVRHMKVPGSAQSKAAVCELKRN